MYCSKCGAFIEKNAKFCIACGNKVVENNNTLSSNVQIENQNNNYNNSTVNYSQNNQEKTSNMNNSHMNQTKTVNMNNSKKTSVSMILGIISIILCFFLNVLIVPVALVGLIIGITEKNKSGKVVGIILNILAVVIPIVILVLIFTGLNGIIEKSKDYSYSQIFEGNGYQLTYNMSWTSGTYSGRNVLAYKYEDDTYLFPIGKSKLSDYSCDFSEITCKNKMYNEFYDLWDDELKENSLTLYKDSSLFSYLKDEIYYVTYSYGKSETELIGQYYLIVSLDDNVILSFSTRTGNSAIFDLLEQEALSLFKTIEIDDAEESFKSDENVIYDDELADMMDSMSNWNRYSSLRTGNLGKKANITGGWRILGDSESYWELKNNSFYWYKSVNDLNDNYWYGTTKVLSGKNGFKAVGLEQSKIDDIISRSKGNITANDIYTIVCTPTKIISDGVDKSATNIPANSKWNYVWIIVDHGKEGIEAQVLNVNTGDTSYYVKIIDLYL